MDYLPEVVGRTADFQVIMDKAEQPEIDGAWAETVRVLNNGFIESADEYGVSRWEGILRIVPRATEGLADRKFRILTRINEHLPYTLRTLHHMLATLCGADGYSISLNHGDYEIRVRIGLFVKNQYEEAKALLERVLPANLVLDIRLLYNTHRIVGGFSHRELARYAHRQVREDVLVHDAALRRNTHSVLGRFAHGELSRFTHRELKEEDLNGDNDNG